MSRRESDGFSRVARRHDGHWEAATAGLVVFIAGCSGSAAQTVYRATAGAPTRAREPSCHFLILSGSSGPGWREVGRVAVVGSLGGTPYRLAVPFAEDVRRDVCAAGGDALVLEADENGWIYGGIVLKRERTNECTASDASRTEH